MFPPQCVTTFYVPPVKLPKLLAIALVFALLIVLLFMPLSILRTSSRETASVVTIMVLLLLAVLFLCTVTAQSGMVTLVVCFLWKMLANGSFITLHIPSLPVAPFIVSCFSNVMLLMLV